MSRCAFHLTLLLSSSVWSQTIIPDEFLVPDPARNPGHISSAVRQDNLSETVCDSGWTARTRPSSHYARSLKAKQMIERGLPGELSDYREDHRVPLCAGGHPRDARNLWPQPFEGSYSDNDKNQLELSVCRGRRERIFQAGGNRPGSFDNRVTFSQKLGTGTTSEQFPTTSAS